jgi:hypothetical protein
MKNSRMLFGSIVGNRDSAALSQPRPRNGVRGRDGADTPIASSFFSSRMVRV